MSFKVFGKIIEAKSGVGVPDLIVRATDKDRRVDDFLGAATTDENGCFLIAYEARDFMDFLFDWKPDIYLTVSDQAGTLLHTTEDFVRYGAGKSEEFIIAIPHAIITGGKEAMKEPIEKERLEFRKLLSENVNYFGTHPETKLDVVKPMKGNTNYEELRCIGLYPEQDLLEAVFDVKLPHGFGGPLCSNGSFAYVRFYVDWDGDGDFDEADEDVGMSRVNLHNIPNDGGLCRKEDKPLSYAVQVKLDPKKYGCKKPYLVKVRAILSWDAQPPPGTPDYPPIWGNVLEKWIQIEPREYLVSDVIKGIDFEKLEIDPELLNLTAPISTLKKQPPGVSEEGHAVIKMPEKRLKVLKLASIAAQIKQQPELMAQYQADPAYAEILEDLQDLVLGKSSTQYEELTCVGQLHG